MEQSGVDGMILMRVTGREKQTSYTPGYWTGVPFYRRGWRGYWGYGRGAVYQPG